MQSSNYTTDRYFYATETLAICQCFCIVVFCFVTNSCANKQITYKEIKAIDTIVLDYKITKIKSYYNPEYNTQVNTYFRNYNTEFALCFCIDSITPTTLFPIRTQVQNCITENKNSCIVQYAGVNPKNEKFYRIYADKTIDTLDLYLGKRDNEDLILESMPFGFPFKINKDGVRLYYTNVFLKSSLNYRRNKMARIRAFSHGFADELEISKHKIIFNGKTTGHYPKIHLSDSVYNYYFPWIALNKNLDFVTCYFFIDSIFVTHPDNSQEHFSLLSRYKTESSKTIDASKIFDYEYLNRDADSRLSYMYLRYDYYRNLYYVVAAKPMPFENEDGTRNSPADKPWSLIVLDSTFSQIAEIDMPKQFSKHEIMVTKEGIAVLDENLTAQNPGKSVFVILKLK